MYIKEDELSMNLYISTYKTKYKEGVVRWPKHGVREFIHCGRDTDPYQVHKH